MFRLRLEGVAVVEVAQVAIGTGQQLTQDIALGNLAESRTRAVAQHLVEGAPLLIFGVSGLKCLLLLASQLAVLIIGLQGCHAFGNHVG